MAGAHAGQLVPEGAFGIDYALPAMFLALLALQIRGRDHAFAAGISAALSVALALLMPGNAHVVIASVVAATLGLALRRSRAARGYR